MDHDSTVKEGASPASHICRVSAHEDIIVIAVMRSTMLKQYLIWEVALDSERLEESGSRSKVPTLQPAGGQKKTLRRIDSRYFFPFASASHFFRCHPHHLHCPALPATRLVCRAKLLATSRSLQPHGMHILGSLLLSCSSRSSFTIYRGSCCSL